MKVGGFASRYGGEPAWNDLLAGMRTIQQAPRPFLPHDPLPRSRTQPVVLIVCTRCKARVSNGQAAAAAGKDHGLKNAADRAADLAAPVSVACTKVRLGARTAAPLAVQVADGDALLPAGSEVDDHHQPAAAGNPLHVVNTGEHEVAPGIRNGNGKGKDALGPAAAADHGGAGRDHQSAKNDATLEGKITAAASGLQAERALQETTRASRAVRQPETTPPWDRKKKVAKRTRKPDWTVG